jgi:hypothetical protein
MYPRSLLYRRRRAKTIPLPPLSMSPAGTSHCTKSDSHPTALCGATLTSTERAETLFFHSPTRPLCARARLDPPSLRSTSWRPLFHLDTESPRNGSLTSSLLPVTDHRRGALPEHNLPIMAITTEDAASCFVFFCF